ncbi:MAG: hydantoinase/oxoprolinase family protein [Methylovulum sp.]
MNQRYSIGWDIGGAHIKAAAINQAGQILTIVQQPCPLWKGLAQLQQAVALIMQSLPMARYCHAITMTGELVDLFTHRDDGVRQIIAAMRELFPESELLIFAGTEGLLPIAQIEDKHYPTIASANWLASALFAAQKVGQGLFIDIGSTTTDILLLKNNQVLAEGYTDYQRLVSQELVYTGIIRTPVMAVAQTALDDDKEVGVMAEYFATMADVYRITGELNEAHDQTETADGAEKSVNASARRLARMIGCDFFPEELPRWRKFAKNIRIQQLELIELACAQQLSRISLAKNSPIIGAGVGRFLVKQLAGHLNYPYLDFADLFPETIHPAAITIADCAPAVAIACLAHSLSDD